MPKAIKLNDPKNNAWSIIDDDGKEIEVVYLSPLNDTEEAALTVYAEVLADRGEGGEA